MQNKGYWYKKEPQNKIYWFDSEEPQEGAILFTFDKKTVFNLFADYPHKLTAEQVALFDKENPFWAKFFADRKKGA